jgi:hypothetical protein
MDKSIKKEIEQKKAELEELKKQRSNANCVSVNSSTSEVTRQMKIEELEDDIQELQKKAAQG